MGAMTKAEKIRLTIIAFVLSGLAFAAASPDGFSGINKQPNFISVIDLAQKIKKREELQLIDLRESQFYNEFHIPTARNIPLGEIDFSEIDPGTVFYSGDDLLSRKLWDSALESERSKITILYGGVRDWYDRLLYPTLPYGDMVDDPELLGEIHTLCDFYGGFADFESDAKLLNYYQINLSTAKWPSSQRKGTLVRKGC